MSTQTWDRKITLKNSGRGDSFFGLNLPVDISRALQAKGYDRVRIELTAEGILVRPYVSTPDGPNTRVADLPETWA